MGDKKGSGLAQITALDMVDDEVVVIDDGASKRILVGDLLTLDAATIYTDGGSGTQTPGTSYALMTQWASDGPELGEASADSANNKITVVNDGVYEVSGSLSFEGTGSSVVDVSVYWNGVEQPQCGFRRKLGVNGDVGAAGIIGLVDVTTGSTDFDVRVKCDGASDVFDLKRGTLTVKRIGGT